MAAGQADESVALRIDGDAGDDADAHADLHIGLDHVGVDRFEHDRRLDPGRGERFIDLRAAGEQVLVSDQRIAREVLQRQLARRRHQLRQRMLGLDDRNVLPVVDRDRQQSRRIVQ